MNGIWQDVWVGARLLTKHRQFTVVSILILAAGVGATTAVFSVVNAVLLRPLPYVDPQQLVAIVSLYTGADVARRPVVRLTDVAEWRTRSRGLALIGAFAYTQLPVRAGERALSPVTALMDAEFLPTLGNPLQLGTFFDRGPGPDMTAIISHAMWIDAFNGDPAAIGRAIVVDGAAFTVRGVLAAGFQFPRSDASYFTKPVDLLLPSSSFRGFPPQSRQWFAIGRLAPGVSVGQAQSELAAIAEAVSREQSAGPWSVQLAPLAEETARRARQPLLVVLGIALVLLLIAATNLMNLFFSRGSVRLQEISIRRALGGSMVRLMRQLMIETVLLALAGGALGMTLALVGIDAIVSWSPVHLPITGGVSIDGRVLAFSMAICGGAALLAALVPALGLARSAEEAARSAGLRVSAGRAVTRLQQALCVVQIGLGVGLLAVAGLLANSLWRLASVPPGFNPHDVIGFNLSVPNSLSLDERRTFYARALEEIRTIPGVRQAGMISFLPPETRAGVFMGVGIDAAPPVASDAPPRTANTLVSSVGYFPAVEMRIVQGRDFSEADSSSAPPVVIVNEAFVRRYLQGGGTLGRRIGTGFDRLKPVREIVGIVADAHDRGLGVDPMPTVYVSAAQFALPYSSIAIRTRSSMAAVVPVVRDRLTRLDPSVPLSDFQRLDERVRDSLREPRFYTMMALTCALMAILFVAFGLYGLVSYSVSRRTSELGVRMAVGADRGRILGLVLAQGLRLSLAGVGLGLLFAYAGSRALRSQLFGVEPADPLTLAAASALVVIVTLAASFAPALRASRVSPLAALRHE